MCLIIEKNAGQTVPFEHLLAGAHRNSDGYGVVVHDRGNLEIVHGLGSPEVAAKKVSEVLEQAKDNLAYVHFRYRTIGEVTLDNTHPITVLKKSADGIDMQFLHNGTISRFYAKDSKSDSVVFAEQILAPLARRSANYLGAEQVTSDPLLIDILKRYAEGTSKFVLLDGNGNSLVVNRGDGVEQAYGWASNAYSLLAKNIPADSYKSSVVYSSAWPKATTHQTEHEKLVETLKAQQDFKPSDETCHPKVRVTVEEITGYKPEAFRCLDQDQIRELVTEEPDLATILLLDLLYVNYNEAYREAA